MRTVRTSSSRTSLTDTTTKTTLIDIEPIEPEENKKTKAVVVKEKKTTRHNQIKSENVRAGLMINKELKKQVEELAKESGRSFNNYIVTLLQYHVNEVLNESNKSKK